MDRVLEYLYGREYAGRGVRGEGRGADLSASVLTVPDWHRTIRANLKNYDRKRRRLILEALHFFSRVERHLPWHIIMAVDCSGSMMDSVIYSAIMAGIFKGLPSVRVSLVAFDTAVVD